MHRLRGWQTNDEQAERIGARDDRGTFEDQRAAGLDGNAGKSGGMRRLDRLRADGRQIGAQFLTGLGAFDQDTARPSG